eukprot:TRINITY_DN1310_c0_g1_i10.p1 TRINITY_DN1310_c0_g1~~TRINITY_DN1310_c0_g1_i10.p1  ORF type:complete len:154 (+),score=21.22 TRINITY_DN1310_c0_g1_i10:25-486(+)
MFFTLESNSTQNETPAIVEDKEHRTEECSICISFRKGEKSPKVCPKCLGLQTSSQSPWMAKRRMPFSSVVLYHYMPDQTREKHELRDTKKKAKQDRQQNTLNAKSVAESLREKHAIQIKKKPRNLSGLILEERKKKSQKKSQKSVCTSIGTNL